MKCPLPSLAVAQLDPIVGDIEGNAKKAFEAIQKAKNAGVQLLIFPELFFIGYPPYDLLFEADCMPRIQKAVADVASICVDIDVVLGAPWGQPDAKGRVYNAALHLSKGRLQGQYLKQCLPFYDVFYEPRYFQEGHSSYIFTCQGAQVGICICEDLWSDDLSCKGIYCKRPLDQLKGRVDLLVSLTSSPWYMGKTGIRDEVFRHVAQSCSCPLVVANQVGANDDLLFDGASVFVSDKGAITWRAPSWHEGVFCVQNKGAEKQSETLLPALVMGIVDYFRKVGATDAVIGLSGGIDSSATAGLLTVALGKEHVHGFFLPSRFTSKDSVEDVYEVQQTLGISLETISIEPMFIQTLKSLNLECDGQPGNIRVENIQARIRSLILMAQANKEKHLLVCAANKSELSMGYGTLYGDLSGALAPIGDLWKQDSYNIGKSLCEKRIVLPKRLFEKAPSAELCINQKDEEELPLPYHILEASLEDSIIARRVIAPHIRSRIFKNEFKRAQGPVVLKVSPKAFGVGRMFPIAQQFCLLS